MPCPASSLDTLSKAEQHADHASFQGPVPSKPRQFDMQAFLAIQVTLNPDPKPFNPYNLWITARFPALGCINSVWGEGWNVLSAGMRCGCLIGRTEPS